MTKKKKNRIFVSQYDMCGSAKIIIIIILIITIIIQSNSISYLKKTGCYLVFPTVGVPRALFLTAEYDELITVKF